MNLTNPKTIVFVFAFLLLVDPQAQHAWAQVLVGLGILAAVWTPSRAR